ncbi:hypothetical protein EG850_08120 [Gulosibacter macacae]|uniref:EthD domain-containing protein n=1 Tax=Gulosibacter macacae TaxID=2488791 RepID=A0A3P3VVY0_9MICO|nr:EthD domain-containing protein [Gulosibacter macacae]RRJ86604.1 hypothetical protein EG850_08120 [Gulosibacter macacae]
MSQDPAYKLVILLTRSPEITREEFARRIVDLESTAPVSKGGLQRRVVTTGLATVDPESESPFDAAIETWWTRKNDAADWVVSQTFENDWLAPRLPLLACRPHAIAGEPAAPRPNGEDYPQGAVQLIALTTSMRSRRKDEFAAAYVRHAELASSGLESGARITRLEFVPAPLAAPSRFSVDRYDGVGTIVFAAESALADEVAKAYYRDVVVPDAARFSDIGYSHILVGSPTFVGPT